MVGAVNKIESKRLIVKINQQGYKDTKTSLIYADRK